MVKIFERAFLEPNSIEAVSVEIETADYTSDDWFGANLVLVNQERSFAIYFSNYDSFGEVAFSKERFQAAVNKLRTLQNALGLIETHMVEHAKQRYPELLQPVTTDTPEDNQEIEVTAEEEEYQQGLVQVDISDKVNEFPKL